MREGTIMEVFLAWEIYSVESDIRFLLDIFDTSAKAMYCIDQAKEKNVNAHDWTSWEIEKRELK